MRSWHVDQRKFWGWGDPGYCFDDAGRPGMWPFFERQLGLNGAERQPAPDEDAIAVSAAVVNEPFLKDLQSRFEPDQIALDDRARLRHSYGQSYRDLLRLRKGIVEASPDAVVYPNDHEQCLVLLSLCREHNVVCVPFGGGTNIFRMTERDPGETRMAVCADTVRMNRLLDFDPSSRTARFQCGVFGPDLDAQLAPHGFELGHRPDSYELSTLGGWIATRSAGMFSTSLGKIEDMVVSLRVATPDGGIETRPAPASSCGPDFKSLLIGSEGVLGIITEAVMRVRPLPKVRRFQSWLFPTFAAGVEAARELTQCGAAPDLIRLLDPMQMQFIGSLAHAPGPFQRWTKKAVGTYLRRARGFDPGQQCMMFLGFEGDGGDVKRRTRAAGKIVWTQRAFPLGPGPAEKWYEEVYLFGYFRDLVYQHAILGDAAETSTQWSNVLPLHEKTVEEARRVYAEMGLKGYIGCHVSHAYPTGASLYFIMVCKELEGRELDQHRLLRDRVTRVIVENGGALSHHHSVGRELMPYMEMEHGPRLVETLRSIKKQMDPHGILNPGNLIPPEPVAGEPPARPV